jgi:hypothetical protein
MPSAFNVTTTTNDLRLDDSRQGLVALTVSNTSGKPQQGRLILEALDLTKADWLKVEGPAERNFPIGDTQQYVIQVVVPKDAASGHYTYRPNVVAVALPDEDSTEGPTLAFEVPEPPPQPKPTPFPWPIVGAAAAAVVLVGAVLAYLLVFRVPETIWVDDSLPAGAVAAFDGGDSWTWVSANPSPYSGALAHQSNIGFGEHQHYFYGATPPLVANPGDTLFTYVFLDPANPPTEVMIQWYSNFSWEHRAIWGADQMAFGTAGQPSRYNAGPLPATGQWVRLEVTAANVGLEGRTVTGLAFTLYGGRATWDRAGKHGSR